MIRRLVTTCLLSLTLAQPALALSKKEQDCTWQAQIVAAVQKARLDGVRQEKVVETIQAGDPAWPDNYDNAIPLFAAQIYQIKKRDLRATDLSAEWMNTCMTN